MEAEFGVMQSLVKEHLEPPKTERAKKDSSLKPSSNNPHVDWEANLKHQ